MTDFAAMRHAMVVSQLRPNAVSDPRVIAAMAGVPREHFLPAELAALAYRDRPLPLGNGRALNQPEATGRLLSEARVRADDKVLLIGAAGGYTAALLATLAGLVVAVENDPALLAIARSALVGSTNVTLVEAPLAEGAPSEAPYNLIVVDGAVEQLPEVLIDQLAPGGRLVTGIVDRGVTRLALGTRTAGGFGLADFADVDCVTLPGFARPAVFAF
ncbi:protein-L-isoaspartate O-methyltransferase family protein [Sphingomonas sp. GlSt437]